MRRSEKIETIKTVVKTDMKPSPFLLISGDLNESQNKKFHTKRDKDVLKKKIYIFFFRVSLSHKPITQKSIRVFRNELKD